MMTPAHTLLKKFVDLVKGSHPGLYIANSGTSRDTAINVIEQAKDLLRSAGVVEEAKEEESTDSDSTIPSSPAVKQKSPISNPVVAPKERKKRESAGEPDTEKEQVAIVEYLKGKGWLGRGEIMTNVGIDETTWKFAIANLLAIKMVKKTGEKRGTKYHVWELGD